MPVAITVMKSTLASSGRAAICTTARAACATSITGSGRRLPSACGTPVFIGSVISEAALPMSIWPTAMPCARPSSAAARVRPVIACFVAV
jgi:hypothetical protein